MTAPRAITITLELSPAEWHALEVLAAQQPPKTPEDILRDEFGCVLHDRFEKLCAGFRRAEEMAAASDFFEEDFRRQAFERAQAFDHLREEANGPSDE